MSAKYRYLFAILGILLISFSVVYFFKPAPAESSILAEKKPSVVATTGMIADATRNLAGHLAHVTALMGAGVDPHLYKASAGDIDRLEKADLILFNGLHLEGKITDVLKRMGNRKPTLAVAEKIPKHLLISEESDIFDPHVWFDIRLWLYVVQAIRDSLIELLPQHSRIIEENFHTYKVKLQELDSYIRSRVSEIPVERRVLITAHDAFEYFGRAYGFEVRGLQGISTVTEAGTKDVQDLANFITTRRIPAIFVESSVPVKNIEALQAAVKARGFEVRIGGELFSDAMGDEGTPEGTYLGMLRHNIETIVSALKDK